MHISCISRNNFALIYTETKTQSSISLFVSYCINCCTCNHISDMSSKGSNNTSRSSCTNLFWFNTNYLALPGSHARYPLLKSHDSTRTTSLVKLVCQYLYTVCTSSARRMKTIKSAQMQEVLNESRRWQTSAVCGPWYHNHLIRLGNEKNGVLICIIGVVYIRE